MIRRMRTAVVKQGQVAEARAFLARGIPLFADGSIHDGVFEAL